VVPMVVSTPFYGGRRYGAGLSCRSGRCRMGSFATTSPRGKTRRATTNDVRASLYPKHGHDLAGCLPSQSRLLAAALTSRGKHTAQRLHPQCQATLSTAALVPLGRAPAAHQGNHSVIDPSARVQRACTTLAPATRKNTSSMAHPTTLRK
jgi:hypothetical protein